jgi:hypothetical protein
MKGGALLGDQLYHFFQANKYNDDSLLPDNFVPLNKNNKNLYNDYVNVYINPIFGDKMLFSKPNNYKLNSKKNKYITVTKELNTDEKLLSDIS